MSINNPLPILICIVLALATVWLLAKIFRKDPEEVKFTSIDGLRGFLAFSVFIHHAWIWHHLIVTKEWALGDSELYAFMGSGSVSIFFMVTGFLFVNKLIEKRGQTIDWIALFSGRIMRLGPVYLAGMLVLFLLVFVHTNFKLNVPFTQLLNECWHWIVFCVFGFKFINEAPDFLQMHGGVAWSLSYEWMFYLALPIIALLFFRIRSSEYIVLITAILIVLIYWLGDLWYRPCLFFIPGALASFAIRSQKFRKVATSHFSSVFVVGGIFCAIYFFPGAENVYPAHICIGISFALIAGGNSLFGLLSLRISRLLGQLSYPIYLFHPFVLFYCIRYIIRMDVIVKFSDTQYWCVIFACTPVLISICFLIHYTLERPAMKKSKKLSAKTHSLFQRLGLEKKEITS